MPEKHGFSEQFAEISHPDQIIFRRRRKNAGTTSKEPTLYQLQWFSII